MKESKLDGILLDMPTLEAEALISNLMARIGRAGGKAGTGPAKRRTVDYAELGRRGAEARKRKKEAPQ